MNRRLIFMFALVCLLILFCLTGFVRAASGGYGLTWWSADGGGGGASGGSGSYDLNGTIGQPDAGAMSGTGYQLAGGYWSGPAIVLPPPGAFNKSMPANNATGQPANATLSWGTSSGATRYEYCYGKTKPCSNWTTNGTATSKVLSNLAASTTFYWNVRAVNTSGTTYANASTTDWSFKTGPIPGAFVKSAPSNGATGQSATPTLKWGASAGTTRYEYCYGKTKPCSNWTTNGTATSKVLSNLAANTTYYWNVRAVNANGTTYANASTTDWSFKTGPNPGAFVKSAPSNGATGQLATPTLKWGASSGATSYQYCYSKTNPCTAWLSAGKSTSKALSGLTANTTYYWNVRAVNANGTTYSNGSTADWHFKTK